MRAAVAPAAAAPPRESAGAAAHAAEKNRRAELRRLRARLGEIERENAKLTERARAITEELSQESVAADYVRVGELTQELDGIRARTDELAEEWMEQAELLESAED